MKEFNFPIEMVNSLPEKEKTVIFNHYILKKSISEIAKLLGIGESRVYQIRAKGYKRLELMSQRLYIVLEQNEWPDGFYLESNGQRFGDFASALNYIAAMRTGYVDLAKENGCEIIEDIWEDNYSRITRSDGWAMKLYIKLV